MTELPVSLRGVAVVVAVLACIELAPRGLEHVEHLLFPSAVDVGSSSVRHELDRARERIEQRLESPVYTDADIKNDLEDVGRVYDTQDRGQVLSFHLLVDRRIQSGGGWTADDATIRICFRVDVDREASPAAVQPDEADVGPLGGQLEMPGPTTTAEQVTCPSLPPYSPDEGRVDTVIEP